MTGKELLLVLQGMSEEALEKEITIDLPWSDGFVEYATPYDEGLAISVKECDPED